MKTDRKSFIEGLPARLKAGEQQAFADFAEEFYSWFYHFFLSRGLPEFEAKDLTEDCMADIPMKVVDGKYEERPDASFAAWVKTVMENRARDWWRKHYNHQEEPLPEDIAGPDSEETAPAVAQTVAIQEALWQLEPTHRQIIELYDLGETRTYQEIAEILQISAAAARVRRHRALKELEKILKDDPRIHLRTKATVEGIQTL